MGAVYEEGGFISCAWNIRCVLTDGTLGTCQLGGKLKMLIWQHIHHLSQGNDRCDAAFCGILINITFKSAWSLKVSNCIQWICINREKA